MSTPLKALIIEDNPDDADLLVLELERDGFQVQSERVDTPEDLEKALDKTQWDIIFSDHTMPRFSSFDALKIRNKRELDVPFVILSGTMGEDLAVEAMKAGANDYFVKGRLTRLGAAVNRELQEAREREVLRKTEWELEHFVAALTHDLKTPVSAELRVLELLGSGNFGSLNPDQHQIIGELIQSNHFVQHMINNILFAYKYKQRGVNLEKERTDLAQLIGAMAASKTIQAMTSETSHRLVTEPIDFIPPVEIDRNEIQRVLLNLIKNAVDYTPEGGVITISMVWRGDYVRVSVRDTGPGVDPEVEPYLFAPYATSTAKKYRQLGMGLGLYLSRQIVEAHGGKIGYERKKDGSLFYFDLPVLKAETK